MSSVKQIRVTKDFLRLDDDVKNCNSRESLEECQTRKYLEELDDKCSCVPYRLRDYNKPNQVH